MKPVHSRKNQYRGINAHLNSKLQHEQRGWVEFHSSYILFLGIALKALLRPMGYTAGVEQSLQIRRYDQLIGEPEADVTTYDTDPIRASSERIRSATTDPYELAVPIPVLLNISEAEILYHKAISIQTYNRTTGERGEAVAWIELLSPSNKPGSHNFVDYSDKRTNLIESGLVFVEIDFLHETPPTFQYIRNYARGKRSLPQPGSHPYSITVVDPHPEFLEGIGRTRQFDVDEPIPTMTVPLSGDDIFQCDFGIPYYKTFDEWQYGEDIDYSQLPVNFDLYSAEDQARILARMLAVLEAAEKGVDLETGPFPVEQLELQAALTRFEQWKAKE
jgi:hypothetical protein